MTPAGIDFSAGLKYIEAGGWTAALKHPVFDYETFVRPLETRMMRSIWRIVRDREAAEDALQEALTVIWKKRDTVARHPNPEALILRIAVTEALDALRQSRSRGRREIPGIPESAGENAISPVEEAAAEREFRAEVLAAIGRLPRRQATAVLLRIIEELPFETIARAMGCSEPTARIHVMRGKAALARRLEAFRPGWGQTVEMKGKGKES